MRPNTISTTPGYTQAWNEGADARLWGFPKSMNPYSASEQERLRNAWLEGYRHTSREWAADARWPVKPLPKVRG